MDRNLSVLNTNIIDHNGRRLIELCRYTGLLIANGRLNNEPGNFTFYSHRGLSTIDYLLSNFLDFIITSHFNIADFNQQPDHESI